jgi:putative ABC transport system permease protein
MSIINTLQISLRAMRANKMRTGLTVLGMVIGIAAVIIVFSAGEGIKGLVLGEIESFGTDIIETEIKVPTTKKGATSETQSALAIAQGVQITTLTLDDMADIDNLPNVEKSYAGVLGQEQVSYGNELRKAFLYGVSAAFIDIDKSEVEEGRFFTESEEKSLARVAVLGSKIKEKLFGDSDAIGKSIRIRRSKFRVVGVMEERGRTFGMDFDDYVYVPLRTLQKKVMGIDHVLFMVHKLRDLSLADETAEEIKLILRENHNITPGGDSADTGKDDFRVTTMVEAMETLSTVTGAITLLLLAIVAISLVVGGVGIMNIMYVIVRERTAEIGLRKAVGARYKDIMKQFLTESVLITVMGGIAGIVLGVAVSLLIAWGAERSGLDWRLSFPARSFLVALGFSFVFGVLFGIYPARKAARLNPVEALRAE